MNGNFGTLTERIHAGLQQVESVIDREDRQARRRYGRPLVSEALADPLPRLEPHLGRLRADVQLAAPAAELPTDDFMADPYDFSPSDHAWAGL